MMYLTNYESSTHQLSVLFVDSNVDDYTHLLRGLLPEIPAHVLSPDRDGVEQISEVLARYQSYVTISTVYIIAHGSPGSLQIGDRTLSLSTLSDYELALKAWFKRSHFTVPQLCLYGCSVAAGDAGKEFVQQLSEITGAEVSASSSPIGHDALGGTWHLDTSSAEHLTSSEHQNSHDQNPHQSSPTTALVAAPDPLAPRPFSKDVRASWFGILHNTGGTSDVSAQGADSIPLIFAGKPTTVNGHPIEQSQLINNADVIRVSNVATTFDGTVIDGLIRAIDVGAGMAYTPDRGELSCCTGSELMDGLLRVNLRFVKTGTELEVCLPNLTAQFWDMDADGETAEVVGFSNADSMNIVGLSDDEEIEDSDSFVGNTLSYQLRAADVLRPSTTHTDDSFKHKDSIHADPFDNTERDSSRSDGYCSSTAFDHGCDIEYRVTAQFKQFKTTDIAYGITQSLCATAVVCGLRLNALKITRPRDFEREQRTQKLVSKEQPIGSKKEQTSVITAGYLSTLFVDINAQDYGKVLTNIEPRTRVHILNSREDGIDQITRILSEYYEEIDIHCIHLVSQGAPGCLYLGTSELSVWTLERYRHQIERWKANAVQIYGCQAAAGEAGKALVSELEAMLQVPVLAASTHIDSLADAGIKGYRDNHSAVARASYFSPSLPVKQPKKRSSVNARLS